MRCWRVRTPGPIGSGPLEFTTTPRPEPAPGELLVQVLACGVCRTDLHVAEGDLPVHRQGVIPGHEVVGEVVDVSTGEGPEPPPPTNQDRFVVGATHPYPLDAVDRALGDLAHGRFAGAAVLVPCRIRTRLGVESISVGASSLTR
jgi:threonine dehydrogenase-like Zn-dependent dehydrogenase